MFISSRISATLDLSVGFSFDGRDRKTSLQVLIGESLRDDAHKDVRRVGVMSWSEMEEVTACNALKPYLGQGRLFFSESKYTLKKRHC